MLHSIPSAWTMGGRIYRPGQILKLTLSLSESLSFFFSLIEFLESFTSFKLLVLEFGFCSTSLSVEGEQLIGIQTEAFWVASQLKWKRD